MKHPPADQSEALLSLQAELQARNTDIKSYQSRMMSVQSLIAAWTLSNVLFNGGIELHKGWTRWVQHWRHDEEIRQGPTEGQELFLQLTFRAKMAQCSEAALSDLAQVTLLPHVA